jgi:hypothetical protein
MPGASSLLPMPTAQVLYKTYPFLCRTNYKLSTTGRPQQTWGTQVRVQTTPRPRA